MAKTTASHDLIIALRRKKGENKLTIGAMAEQVGISRRSLYPILDSNGGKPTRPSTLAKLNQWLYQHV